MFHRKLVSEEVAVLDPRIYHRGDGEKGEKGAGAPVAALLFWRYLLISTEDIKAGAGAAGSPGS